jgi:hypothetical protein
VPFAFAISFIAHAFHAHTEPQGSE